MLTLRDQNIPRTSMLWALFLVYIKSTRIISSCVIGTVLGGHLIYEFQEAPLHHV
jgi:hypothetical protein